MQKNHMCIDVMYQLQACMHAALLQHQHGIGVLICHGTAESMSLWMQVLSGEGLMKINGHLLGARVPLSLLSSVFGDAWQQAGFKVQLSVFKDGACIAGGLAA
jgi:hypothetical protein